MYDVSQDFIRALSSHAFRENLKGTIGDISFTASNVLKGSFLITNQCCDASSLKIGQVYVGELDCTFIDLNIPRKNYKKLLIRPQYGVYIESLGEFEYVPLGVFIVDKAEWTQSGINIVAYDNMAKFDKTFSITSTNGTPYDFLMLCCESCNVELGMTKEQVEQLPNGEENLDLYEEINDIETYRDFLSWIAQTTATNALIDREGRLYLKPYNNTAVDELDDKRRLMSGRISDFESFYTGLSIVNIETSTTTYYGLEVDNGLTYNLGQNPLLQYGLDETKERQRRAILNSIAVARYTPCSFSLMQGVVYDLMDCISLTDGIVGEEDALTCVLKYTWRYGEVYSFECVGQDTSLVSVQSKVDKNLAGLLQAVHKDNSSFYIYGFTNAEAYNIITTPVMVTRIDFATVEDARIVFIFQAQAFFTLDGVAVAELYINDELQDTFRMYYSRGNVNIMFQWFGDMIGDMRHTLKVFLHYEYFESDRRRDRAFIDSLKNYVDGLQSYFSQHEIPYGVTYEQLPIDDTIGDITIDIAKCKSILFGRGLAATGIWNGLIEVYDNIGYIDLLNVDVDSLQDNVSLERKAQAVQNITDVLQTIGLNQIAVDSSFSENVNVTFEQI